LKDRIALAVAVEILFCKIFQFYKKDCNGKRDPCGNAQKSQIKTLLLLYETFSNHRKRLARTKINGGRQ
jgi:hypothetical protein